jgi:hypothetical protein
MTYLGDDAIQMPPAEVAPLPAPEEKALAPVFEPKSLAPLAVAAGVLLLLS